jgi:signal transduction histidine kinase
LLAAATLIPIGVLSWLGFRILQQDRDVERQRRRERLEVAAGRLALDMDRRLQDIEEQLARGSDAKSAGVRLLPAGLTSTPDVPLLYQPEVSAGEGVPSSFLAAAERAEFQRHDLAAAEAAYRQASESRAPVARAAALIGLARVLRQRGDHAAALQAYADLEQLGSLVVGGQPAGLVARQGRCKALEEASDKEALRRAAEELAGALNAGGWPIDRATFDLYRDMVERWGAAAPSSDAIAKTAAAVQLWRVWRRGDLAPRGRRVLREEQRPVLAVWAGGPDRPTVWLATPDQIEASFGPLWSAQRLAVSLADNEGQPVLGERQASGITGGLSLTTAETRLPFILGVRSVADEDDEGDRMRRIVLVSGLVIAFVLMLAAAYGVYRTTTRDLMLAREQSDFVSAVSHEFRTPLTSMRHLTELLASRGVTSEERKAQYYELLAHETERLHRMVESLLSFGRIEAGAYAWQLEPVNASELLAGIVEEFRREPLAEGRAIVCEIEQALPPIRADREALSRALWNLLENAGKYSEPGSAIRVFARREGSTVLLGVGDRGAGIPAAERARIFQKFVRGTEAKRAGIRGVGIGLALVQRIVKAHGGSVRLESEPGIGSTFTIVLTNLATADDTVDTEVHAVAEEDCSSVSPASPVVGRFRS